MIEIEKYLPKAFKMEAAFLKNRNLNEIRFFPKKSIGTDDILTVPSDVMFQNDEKIIIKAPLSEYLSETYGGFCLPSSLPSQMQDLSPFFHKHDFFEFNYVYNGQIKNHVEGENVIQDNGQLVLMNPNAAHHTALLHKETVYFNILVNRKWAEEIFSNLLSFQKSFFNFFLDSIYGLNNISPYIVFENTPELNQVILRMIEEYYKDDIYCQEMLFSILFELFVLLSRQSAAIFQKQPPKFEKNKLSEELFSYLRRHYAHTSLKETADYFGYTPNYLSHLILKLTGKHFSEIIQDLKIESACRYLSGSGLSTEKIAEILGYNDTSYFSKAFQKKMGMTPKIYRSKNTV